MAKKKDKVQIEDSAPKPKGMLDKIGIKDPENLAKRIMQDFNQSEQTKWLWIPERNEDVKNYFGVVKSAEWPFKGASRLKSQFYRIVVDTFAANLVKSIFLPEKPIRPVPSPLNEGTSDLALNNIKYVEDLHNSLQANEYNLHQVLDKAFPTALIESFCVLHPCYEYLTRDVVLSVNRWVPSAYNVDDLTYDVDTDTVMTKSTQQFVHSVDLNKAVMTVDEAKSADMKEVQFDIVKEVVQHDGIKINQINGYRFYMPLGTPGETPHEKIQRAPYIVHQLFYTIREVLDYADQGYFEDVHIVVNNVANEVNQKDKKSGNGEGRGKPVIAATIYDRQRELITYTKLQQAGFLLDTARLEYEYVEVLKWCGKWNIDGKMRELIVWMDRNTSTILRVEPNIFGIRPYFPIVPLPIDETPFGESLCKVIRPLVQELDLMLRMLVNMAIMKAAPAKFFDPASGFNPATIGQFGPNSWIPAREPARNVLIPPQPEDPTISMELVKLIINFIERITGISETVQGQIANRANTTATEVQSALIRSGIRFDQIYERLKDQLKPMFQYIHMLTLRYMPTIKEVRMMGKENENRLLKIHKMQLQGEFEFELTGNSIVMEQNELQNAMTLYNTLGQHPYVSYKPESIYYILYNIVKRLNPIAMAKILPTPEEVKQLERDRAKVQGQQEQVAAQQQQSQLNSQGQLQAQKQAMEVGTMRQQATQQALDAQMNMQMKQAEFQQKMRHNEETHQAKLRQMEEMRNAKEKAKSESKPS